MWRMGSQSICQLLLSAHFWLNPALFALRGSCYPHRLPQEKGFAPLGIGHFAARAVFMSPFSSAAPLGQWGEHPAWGCVSLRSCISSARSPHPHRLQVYQRMSMGTVNTLPPPSHCADRGPCRPEINLLYIYFNTFLPSRWKERDLDGDDHDAMATAGKAAALTPFPTSPLPCNGARLLLGLSCPQGRAVPCQPGWVARVGSRGGSDADGVNYSSAQPSERHQLGCVVRFSARAALPFEWHFHILLSSPHAHKL